MNSWLKISSDSTEIEFATEQRVCWPHWQVHYRAEFMLPA